MYLNDNLKKEVHQVNDSYSKIIVDTTKEIYDFVDKINADSSVQQLCEKLILLIKF